MKLKKTVSGTNEPIRKIDHVLTRRGSFGIKFTPDYAAIQLSSGWEGRNIDEIQKILISAAKKCNTEIENTDCEKTKQQIRKAYRQFVEEAFTPVLLQKNDIPDLFQILIGNFSSLIITIFNSKETPELKNSAYSVLEESLKTLCKDLVEHFELPENVEELFVSTLMDVSFTLSQGLMSDFQKNQNPDTLGHLNEKVTDIMSTPPQLSRKHSTSNVAPGEKVALSTFDMGMVNILRAMSILPRNDWTDYGRWTGVIGKRASGPHSLDGLKNWDIIRTIGLKAFLDHLHDKYGKVVFFYIVHEPVYSIADPKLHHALATHKDIDRGETLAHFRELFGPYSIFTEKDPEKWKKIHDVYRKALTRLTDIQPSLMENLTKQWHQSLSHYSCTHEAFEIVGEMKRVTLFVFSSVFLNIENIENPKELGNLFTELLNTVFSNTVNPLERQSIENKREALWIKFESVVKRNPGMLNVEFVKELIGIDRDNVTIETLTEEEKRTLRDQLLTTMFAGHETTSKLATWMLLYLIKYPELERKIIQEINESGYAADPSLPNLRKLKTLEALINEILRDRGPIWVYGREAQETVSLTGSDGKSYAFYKGDKILLNSHRVHHDPDYWENPNEFNLDRWNNTKLESGQFTPFGDGPKACLGRFFAKIEAMRISADIILQFKFSFAMGEDIKDPEYTFACGPRPTYIHVERRTNAQSRPLSACKKETDGLLPNKDHTTVYI